MRKLSLLAIMGLLIFLNSCVQHAESEISIATNQADQEKVTIEYAEGFDIVYETNFIKVVTHSIGENTSFIDSVFILLDSTTVLDESCKIINQEAIRLACQSSTHLAFLHELDQLKEELK